MNYEEIARVVEMMPKTFDSHDFIRKFIWECPEQYGRLLMNHKNVATAHGEIAIALLNQSEKGELPIKKSGEVQSEDIFKNVKPCASWIRIDI